MLKLRIAFFAFIIGIVSSAPFVASAAAASFFGPLISEECKCPGSAPGWGCILQIVQNGMNFGISISVIIATLIIAYAGFLWILSPINAENRQKGRTLLLNAVIGMVIVLSAWLVVDFIMKALYDSKSFGPWNEILTGQTDASYCLVAKQGNTNAIANSNGTITTCVDTATTPSGTTTLTGSGGIFLDPNPEKISPKQLQTASPQLASLLSCMGTKVPKGIGRITSISDNLIINGKKTFAQCAAGGAGCNHGTHACHYGGNPANGKVGQSYAVDFGDEQNAVILRKAASECNSDARYYYEGDHIHISLGHYVNAGCDMTMALAGTGTQTSTAPKKDASGKVCTTTVVTTNTTNTTPVITPVAAALVASLTPSPTSIASGGSSKLTWTSTNAMSCVGTGFSTGNAASGSVTVSPTKTTSYGLRCSGANNASTTASAIVSLTSGWDPAAAAKFLDAQAETTQESEGYKCALYVRQAIAAGGITWFNTNHPEFANQYDTQGYLTNSNAGFVKVATGITTLSLKSFAAQQGDVIIFQPICGDSNSSADTECRNTQTGSSPVPTAPNLIMNHPHGHMAMFDGSHWASLWVQDDPWSFSDYVQCGAAGTAAACRPETGTSYSRPGVVYSIFRHP